MDRLYFINDICRSVKFEEYSSSKLVWEDMQHMFDNVIKCYTGEYSKETITQAVEHMRNLFYDLWILYRLSGDDTSEFLDRNQKLIRSLFFKDETVENIFNSFKHKVRSYYDTLTAPTLSDLINIAKPVDVSTEVITSGDQSVSASLVDPGTALPMLTKLEQNPQREGIDNFWDLLYQVIQVLIQREKICRQAGLKDRALLHDKAKKVFVNVFTNQMKSYVFDDRMRRLKDVLNKYQPKIEKRSSVLGYSTHMMMLNDDEMRVYDTPAL